MKEIPSFSVEDFARDLTTERMQNKIQGEDSQLLLPSLTKEQLYCAQLDGSMVVTRKGHGSTLTFSLLAFELEEWCCICPGY